MDREKDKPLNVLLMDDDPTVAGLIRRVLTKQGYRVLVAVNGEEGLRMCREEPWDVLLVDYQMPRADGFDVLAELQKDPLAPPAILITGMGDERIAAEAFKRGAANYIAKDSHGEYLDLLPRAIDAAVRKAHDQRALREAGIQRQKLLEDLQGRVRELGCLYGTERLLAGGDADTSDAVLLDIVSLLTHTHRWEETCCARVHVDGHTCASPGFGETPWRRTFTIGAREQCFGSLEVGFTRAPPAGEPLFLPEEEELYQAVAERIGSHIDRQHRDTQFRRIHDELRKLSRAVEQSASAVMIVDHRGIIEYVNPRFAGMTGYAQQEILGRDPSILKSGERPAADYKELWDTIAAGREWHGEFHNRKKSGELYWDHSTISPITDSAGRITHYLAVKEDISERKEAEMLRAAVLKISAAIAGCQTEDEICRLVVEQIREQMNIDRCGLFLGDINNPPFHGTYGTDLKGRTTDEHEWEWNPKTSAVDLDELSGEMPYQTGLPLGGPEAVPGEEGLSAAAVSLRRNGQIYGVISVDNRISRRPLTEMQLKHAALLAEVLGNALQTARAREALRQSMARLQQANRELEEFNLAMVGREERLIELKQQVNELRGKLGQGPAYPPIWEDVQFGTSSPPGA